MILSVADAANYLDVQRQAIFAAIKHTKRLKAFKDDSCKWWVNLSDLMAYKNSKYSRESSKFQGQPLYKEGELSPSKAAKKIDVPIQHIYYAIHTGRLSCYRTGRKGSIFIIKEQDLEDYRKKIRFRKNSWIYECA